MRRQTQLSGQPGHQHCRHALLVTALTAIITGCTLVQSKKQSAVIENVGAAKSDTCRLAIKVGSEYTPLQFIVPPLNPTQTFMVKRYKIFSNEGTYLCIATADYYDSLTEESELNNIDSVQ